MAGDFREDIRRGLRRREVLESQREEAVLPHQRPRELLTTFEGVPVEGANTDAYSLEDSGKQRRKGLLKVH